MKIKVHPHEGDHDNVTKNEQRIFCHHQVEVQSWSPCVMLRKFHSAFGKINRWRCKSIILRVIMVV